MDNNKFLTFSPIWTISVNYPAVNTLTDITLFCLEPIPSQRAAKPQRHQPPRRRSNGHPPAPYSPARHAQHPAGQVGILIQRFDRTLAKPPDPRIHLRGNPQVPARGQQESLAIASLPHAPPSHHPPNYCVYHDKLCLHDPGFTGVYLKHPTHKVVTAQEHPHLLHPVYVHLAVRVRTGQNPRPFFNCVIKTSPGGPTGPLALFRNHVHLQTQITRRLQSHLASLVGGGVVDHHDPEGAIRLPGEAL